MPSMAPLARNGSLVANTGKEWMERKTWLAFSCTHCPYQDEEAIAWLLEQIAGYRPDVLVHLGDGHEAEAASRWNDEAMHKLLDEYESHNDLLARLRKAAPKRARLVFCEGNHDANIGAKDRLDKRIRELVDYRRHEPELRHWKIIPYINDGNSGAYRLGQVTFTHGFGVSRSAVRADQLTFTREFGLFVHGHTHRPTSPGPAERLLWGEYPINRWRVNPGCMRDLKPEYMRRRSTQRWGQGCIVGTAAPLKSPRARPEWTSETRVFRMYEKWADRAIKTAAGR